MKENVKKYYSVILILAAVALMSVIGLRKNENAVAREDAPQILNNENAVRHLKETGEYDSLAEAFTKARYKIEQNGDALSADNPSNQFAARFSEDGEVQISAVQKDSARQSVWKLKSVGRGAAQTAIGEGVLRSSGNRVENRRAEFGLTEYFENRPDGLEQGFILDAKPTGDENLSLILQTSGALKPSASADGQKIILSDASGAEVLHYDKLKVWDAENKDLTARMTTDETGEIRLEVEDANAVYPLTIDPTFLQSQVLRANDGESNDNFGGSVAISGDTVVVGATNGNGANAGQGVAYVFVRSGSVWTQQAKLTANDGASGDRFGTSVAISGDTVIVGADGDDISPNPVQGSAYIFVRTGNIWSAQEKLIANDGAAGDRFGFSVAYSSDTAIIGAFRDRVGSNNDQGSAYIFVRNGGAWTQQAKLTANDGTASNFFGYSVAIQSSTAIIGAPSAAVNSNENFGAAYIFTRNGTTWTQQAKLIASDGAVDDEFGFSVDVAVSITGTFAVVGAEFDDVAGSPNQGSAYVFTRSQFGTWSQTQKLLAIDGGNSSLFGRAVSIDSVLGNTIIVGASNDNIDPNDSRGFAYIFKRVNSVWTQQQKLTANDGAAFDFFGSSVGISGDTVIAGADSDDVGSNSNQGSAYIFDLRDSTAPFDFDGDNKTDIGIFRPSNGAWYINQSQNGFFGVDFGQNGDLIAPADFDGDGKTDVAVFRNGAWYYLQSTNNAFVGVTFGQAGDLPRPADFDGDGKADINIFRPSNGAWYRLNSSTGAFFSVTFGQNGDKPLIADFDGDGKSDVCVFRPSAASFYSLDSSNGAFRGTAFGFGTDIPTPGDFDGDGKTDVAVFRPSNGAWYRLNSSNGGFSGVAFGQNGDIPVTADYDGDGKADVAVFRNGNWFSLNSSNGAFVSQVFGLGTDKPIPAAFNQ